MGDWKDWKNVSRRRLLKQMGLLGGAAMLSRSGAATEPRALSSEDDRFLEEVEKASYLYFWEQAHPQTGLVKDRCNVRQNDRGVVASIAATGFGLTALSIAEKRGYLTHAQARDRVLTTLRFLWKKLPHHRGFFFHFAHVETGERQWDSEIS